MAEHFCGTCEALGSIPSPASNKTKRQKEDHPRDPQNLKRYTEALPFIPVLGCSLDFAEHLVCLC